MNKPGIFTKKYKKIVAIIMTLVLVFVALPLKIFGDEMNIAAEVMTKESFTASNGIKMPYRLYVPADYSAEKEYSFLF